MRHRGRGQGWPQATPQGTGLDPGEDGVTITAGIAETIHKPRSKRNDVLRHLSTMS
jgi:hypothetical protein